MAEHDIASINWQIETFPEQMRVEIRHPDGRLLYEENLAEIFAPGIVRCTTYFVPPPAEMRSFFQTLLQQNEIAPKCKRLLMDLNPITKAEDFFELTSYTENIEAAHVAGVQYMAVVTHPRVSQELGHSSAETKVNNMLVIRYFKDLDEGRQWLLEKN